MFKLSSATVQLVFRSLRDGKKVFFSVQQNLDPIQPSALCMCCNEAFDLIGDEQLEQSFLGLDPGVDADHGELAGGGLRAAKQEDQCGQVATLQRFHLRQHCRFKFLFWMSLTNTESVFRIRNKSKYKSMMRRAGLSTSMSATVQDLS